MRLNSSFFFLLWILLIEQIFWGRGGLESVHPHVRNAFFHISDFFFNSVFQIIHTTLTYWIRNKLSSDLSRCTGDEWITFYQGSSVHLQTQTWQVSKACETDGWFSEWYKKSSSKDTEKMGGPAWADSVFTTWLTPLFTACLSDKHAYRQTTHGLLSSWVTVWPPHDVFLHSPLCIITSKYQFIYRMGKLKTDCRVWTQSHQQRNAELTQVKCFLMAPFHDYFLLLKAASL